MNFYSRIYQSITLAGARHVRDHAMRRAAELGLSIGLVVVDRAGLLVLAETMDDAPPGSSESAVMKAKGAARYHVATHLTAEFVKTLPAQLSQHTLSLPDVCAFQGGVPIKLGDHVIGGLGIGGGSGAQDIEIALEAAGALNG